MASSGNFSTFNPLNCATTSGYGNHTFANANTQATASSTGNSSVTATIATGSTGKYYAEFYLVATPGNAWVGYCSVLQTPTMTASGQAWVPNGNVTWSPSNLASYFQNGYLYKDGSSQSSWGSTFTTGDIIQIAIDADNDAVYYGKNNTWQNSGNPESGASKTGAARTSIPKNLLISVGHANGGSGTVTWKANFGQDSTFNGTISAGGNADANGFGDFKYAPPSGYVALSTANLPISDDIDPAQTDDDYPSKQFNTITWTGNRSNNSTVNNITGVGFQPDLVWLKFTEQTYDWRLVDSSRGVTEAIRSNQTTEEQTEANGLYQFGSDGFSVKGDNNYNYNGGLFIGYCWKAAGGTTASNSDGDITSTVQANTNAGFSIVTYTGDNTDHRSVGYGSANIGHGLDSAPEFIITKRRNASASWYTLHASAGVGYLTLNDSTAFQSGSVPFGPALPTTTTFGAYSANNNSGATYINYCWHSVEGYSKFSSFVGNGNTDGPFVYTGFRPRMIFLRRTTSGYFNVINSARDTHNPVNKYLSWNATDTEGSGANVDFLSNGFKLRTTASGFNQSGTTFVYGAWGDVPFKYNNTF